MMLVLVSCCDEVRERERVMPVPGSCSMLLRMERDNVAEEGR